MDASQSALASVVAPKLAFALVRIVTATVIVAKNLMMKSKRMARNLAILFLVLNW